MPSSTASIGLLAVFLALNGSAAEKPLPRIRISKDSAAFETATGRKFVPFGVTYFRPRTGWAPQVWKQFDPEATRADFARMKDLGVNCVRVFLSYGSFLSETNRVSEEGLAKFDRFLEIAEATGIYVHPTGPDHWEGLPEWAQSDRYADETVLGATELFWKVFATRYRGRTAIFAYDLLNEPEIRWDTPAMAARWNSWLEKRYGSVAKLKAVWGKSNAELILGKIPVPPREDCPGCSRLTDFQHFREEVADEWTRRQAKAIKAADPQALVTVGMIQWSVPALLAAGWQYSGFRPARQAPLVDFLEIHFYPLANGVYQYAPPDEASNLAYLESVMAEVSGFHKPVVIAEFGWYGGGQPTFGKYAAATEEQQAHWCSKVVTSTAGNACGWLNWGFYDSPGAGDASEFSGLLTADGRLKAWGTEFKKLVGRYQNGKWNLQARGPRPRLDWDLSITSAAEGTKFRKEYLEAWQEERR